MSSLVPCSSDRKEKDSHIPPCGRCVQVPVLPPCGRCVQVPVLQVCTGSSTSVSFDICMQNCILLYAMFIAIRLMITGLLRDQQTRGGSRNSSRGGGRVLGRNSSRAGGLGSRSAGIFIY